MQYNLIDASVDFDEDHHGGKYDTLIIKHAQEIPDEYVSALKRQKIDTAHERLGDFWKVGEVPVVLVEKWLREDGYDVYRAPVRETLARLRKEQLDAFILTNKRV
jgi:hypothetical protein